MRKTEYACKIKRNMLEYDLWKNKGGMTPVWEAFQATGFYKYLITLLTAMLPVVELRGAIPVGVGMGLSNIAAFITAYIGNIIPVPFIILFIRKILEWMKKREGFLSRWAQKLENKAMKHEDTIKKYRVWGLLIFVAIPIPGTGAWTGALIAALFDIRMKHSFPVIALGVLIAGIIVTLLTAGVSFFIS